MFGGRRGRFSNIGGRGLGPGGVCICPSCKYTEPHNVGEPCVMKTCPRCGTRMIRKF